MKLPNIQTLPLPAEVVVARSEDARTITEHYYVVSQDVYETGEGGTRYDDRGFPHFDAPGPESVHERLEAAGYLAVENSRGDDLWRLREVARATRVVLEIERRELERDGAAGLFNIVE